MFVKCEILAIESKPIKTSFTGIIFKENVRSYDLDNLDILKCFKPNDILRCRIISEQSSAGGSGKEASTLLSTVEDEMGVVYARSEESGMLMIPRNWDIMQCLKTKKKERRKIAKYDFGVTTTTEEDAQMKE